MFYRDWYKQILQFPINEKLLKTSYKNDLDILKFNINSFLNKSFSTRYKN